MENCHQKTFEALYIYIYKHIHIHVYVSRIQWIQGICGGALVGVAPIMMESD